MAISLKASAAAWTITTSDPTAATLVGTPAAGDRYYLWVAWKAFGTTCQVISPQAWNEITEFTDGSVAAADGVGSVKVACYYRDWQSGDGNPSIDWSASPVPAYYQMELWQKGSTETWSTPTFVTGTHASSAGPVTRSASSTITVPDNSVVLCQWGIPNQTNSMDRSTTAIDVASGITWNGNYVRDTNDYGSSSASNNLSSDVGYRFVTTGGAGVTLRSTITLLTTAQTGAILWVVQGVTGGAAPAARSRQINPVPIYRSSIY